MTHVVRSIYFLVCWLVLATSAHATLQDLVLAPPDTEILPEHQIYTHVHTLTQVQEASLESATLIRVFVYPGYYSDRTTTHLYGVDISGVTDASLDWDESMYCLAPGNGYAVLKTQLILHQNSLIDNVVVDVGGLQTDDTLACVKFGNDCESAIVTRSALINSMPQCSQPSFGVLGDPPSNSYADDPYTFYGNFIHGHHRGMYFGPGFRSGYDPEQDSFDGYSVFYYNTITGNQTGLAFALNADTDMGSTGFHGENTFKFNETNILLERNAEDVPVSLWAVGNHWYDQHGRRLVTERQVYRTINLIDIDDTGVPFQSMDKFIRLDLPRPPGPPRVDQIKRHNEVQQHTTNN